VKVDELIAICPRVYHVASAAAWTSIQEHGLLTTVELLELFDVPQAQRDELLTRQRTESIRLEAPGRPPAVIRDQKPMKFLEEKVEPGQTIEDFLMAINSRVFFWATRNRLDRLLLAREYRNDEQMLLHIDTRKLVERYEHKIQLCRFNSGAITQMNHPNRSRDSWLSIGRYPYQQYRRRYGRDGALAEVTVVCSVPDVLDLAADVELIAGPDGCRH
jgi:hypothetical protein